MGRFLPNARKPRPVLIEFSSVEEKHKLLRALWTSRCPNNCFKAVLSLMTSWQNGYRRRGALLTLTSKLWKKRSSYSEAQY